MGTRSLTFVYDENNKPIVNLYRQYDGYPRGHGKELADFITPITIVNGFGRETANLANGMGCLAAQIVAHFKQSVGGFYIHSVEDTDCGQDYEYHVFKDRVRVKNYDGEIVFDGDYENFRQFCSAEETF